MALLRIIGLQKRATSGILVMQVMLFTLPAILVGIVLSMGLYAAIAKVLNQTLRLALPLALPFSAYLWATIVGLLAPLIAIAAPIYSLSKTKLVDSLDYQHAVTPTNEMWMLICRMLKNHKSRSLIIGKRRSPLT